MRAILDRPRLALLASALLIVTACSTPGGAGPGGSGPVASGRATGPDATASAPSAQLAAALLPVTPVSTEAGAVTGLLDPNAPLVLDATGPDGATFHAEFPAGAATTPVTITMQPLQSIGGLSGAIEAVSFEPSGLVLAQPAVLTIDGPVANALTARAFGYQDSGAGNVARPVITASAAGAAGPLRLLVGHFSGYGAAADDPPAWTISTITATEAGDIIALEDFVLANAYRAKRSGSMSEAEADQVISNALDAIASASQRLGDSAVAAAATGNVSPAAQAEISAAIAVILESARADQLLGRPGDPAAMAKVTQIVDAYLEGVTKHCTDTHDLTSLTLLRGLARQAQLLHGDTSGQLEVSRCTAATVHFQTTITGFLTDPGTDNATYGGTIRIDVSVPIDLFDGLPSPTVPISVPSTLVFVGGGCTVSQFIDDSTFAVLQATLKQSFPKPTTPLPPGVMAPAVISDATVQVSIGSLAVHGTESGNCGPGDTSGDFIEVLDHLWNDGFNSHGTFTFDGGFEIPGKGSSVLARRTIDRTLDGGHAQSYSSTTLIEIIHTP